MKKYMYVNAAKEKFYVTEDEYREFYREVDAKRKREQYHHRCYCTKEFLWKCDGDCDICQFHSKGDFVSLYYENEAGMSLVDNIPDDMELEQIVADSALLEELFEKLKALDPDGEKIVKLWMSDPDISDRKIAEQLGRKQRTFANQIKKIRKVLKNTAQIDS